MDTPIFINKDEEVTEGVPCLVPYHQSHFVIKINLKMMKKNSFFLENFVIFEPSEMDYYKWPDKNGHQLDNSKKNEYFTANT